MDSTTRQKNRTVLVRFLSGTFAFLASLKLAVILLVLLAAVLAAASSLEARHGADLARWFVYESVWFIALLGLLGLNIFAAAAIRFPWKRHQTGFVVTHVGLLILLAGSLRTFLGGIQGEVSLLEGQTTRYITIPERGRITASWLGKPHEPPYEFSFVSGPVDWRPGKTLDLGELDGVRARVLRFLRHSQAVGKWVPDETKQGGPAAKIQVAGPDGRVVADYWLADQGFGDGLVIGPLRIQLEQAINEPMLDDFTSPPTELGERGVLVICYQDIVQHGRVDDNLAKEIELAGKGIKVSIVEYLANAHPADLGTFVSRGEEPKNPMLNLQIKLAGRQEPYRQIAFAKEPLLNFDGVYKERCPVRFRYYHPAAKPQTGVEFLQGVDGKLYARVAASGAYQFHGQINAGDKIALPSGFTISLVDFLPRANREITFEPARLDAKTGDSAEAAALVQISTAGGTYQTWLQRNSVAHGRRIIDTPQGKLELEYDMGQLPLGFSLSLVELPRESNAGIVSQATRVRLVAPPSGLDTQHVIAMNNPLTHGKFTLYKSSLEDGGHGSQMARFRVTADPGRTWKYVGGLLICVGIGLMFCMRAYCFTRIKPVAIWRPPADAASDPAEDDLGAATQTTKPGVRRAG